jgi:hypothetical protein
MTGQCRELCFGDDGEFQKDRPAVGQCLDQIVIQKQLAGRFFDLFLTPASDWS